MFKKKGNKELIYFCSHLIFKKIVKKKKVKTVFKIVRTQFIPSGYSGGDCFSFILFIYEIYKNNLFLVFNNFFSVKILREFLSKVFFSTGSLIERK